MKRSFWDANLLLEVMLGRDQGSLIEYLLAEDQRRSCVSSLTVHQCYYFGEKNGIPATYIDKFLHPFDVLSLGAEEVKLAQRRFSGKDFEDCLQAACAEAGNCDEIITLDKDFKKLSGAQIKVKVVS